MKSKRILLFRAAAIVVLVAIAAVMMVIGRGHTVYFDNQSLEYEGQTYETPYKVVIYTGGEEVAKLYDGERGMATCIGQSLDLTLEITQEKGGEEEMVSVTVPLPYNMDGVVINLSAYLQDLPEEAFDSPLGSGTGAAVIFGATGGVMEAALRTAVETITGETLGKLDFTEVRGVEGVKEASYNVGGLNVKVAVASGLANARELLEKVKRGEGDYTFIEIMGCPGGCVNGGGQPQVPYGIRNFVDIRAERAKVLYELDENNPIRKSHENPDIQELYANYLGEPGSEKAHHLLHTSYVARTVNPKF